MAVRSDKERATRAQRAKKISDMKTHQLKMQKLYTNFKNEI
jgi:hypothetical protein